MVIDETSSKLATRLEVLTFEIGKIKRHNRLIQDCWRNGLDYRTQGWCSMLSTKAMFDGTIDQNREKLRHELPKLERELAVLLNRWTEDCYRRRKQCRLKALVGMEIGKRTKRLHAHLVVTHSGDVNKSLARVQREVAKQWGRVYEFDELGLVDVKEIYDIYGAIHYATKSAEWMMNTYQVGSVFTS